MAILTTHPETLFAGVASSWTWTSHYRIEDNPDANPFSAFFIPFFWQFLPILYNFGFHPSLNIKCLYCSAIKALQPLYIFQCDKWGKDRTRTVITLAKRRKCGEGVKARNPGLRRIAGDVSICWATGGRVWRGMISLADHKRSKTQPKYWGSSSQSQQADSSPVNIILIYLPIWTKW